MPQQRHPRPALERVAGDVEGEIEHSSSPERALDDERRPAGAVQDPALEARYAVDVEGSRGGQGHAAEGELVPGGARQALETERRTGQQRSEAWSPEQSVVGSPGDGENAAAGQPLLEGGVLAGAQSLEREAVHDESGDSVIARPSFGEPFHPRVEHPQAAAPGVVQIVQIDISTEDEDEPGVGDAGAQIHDLARALPSPGEHPYLQGPREALEVHSELKALARAPRQVDGTPVDVGERLAAELVAVRHPDLEMPVQPGAAVLEGHCERYPLPESKGAREAERDLDLHRRAGGEPRHRGGSGAVRRPRRRRSTGHTTVRIGRGGARRDRQQGGAEQGEAHHGADEVAGVQGRAHVSPDRSAAGRSGASPDPAALAIIGARSPPWRREGRECLPPRVSPTSDSGASRSARGATPSPPPSGRRCCRRCRGISPSASTR